ncbi:MAG: ankyrin repeat domain-containing protein [Alphaproteobacteria bacterium]
MAIRTPRSQGSRPTHRLATAVMAAALMAGMAGMPASAQFGGGDTPDLITAIEERDFEGFKLALVNETRPTLRDTAGVPALILAVESRESFFVEALLEAGARPDDRPRKRSDDRTALSRAAALGEAGMVKALLDAGADPDMPGTRGEAPLITAAFLGHVDVARILIEAEADLEITEMTGRTALEVARRNNQVAIVRLLEAAGAY